MASRPVFIVNERRPYYHETSIDFTYNSGFATVQKQKNINALHRAFLEEFPDKPVLEISSKSLQPEGEPLSAFFLPKYVPSLGKYVPSLGKSVPVECVYQGGKVLTSGGPYTDLYERTPREAKKDERLKNGSIIGFQFEGESFPTRPSTIFYDYIYINALLENEDLAQKILQYRAFTDIEFNPKKSLNCQARAAAEFVSLTLSGQIEKVRSFDSFLRLFQI